MAERTPIVDRFWKHVVEIGGPMDTPCWTHRRNPVRTLSWNIYVRNAGRKKFSVPAARWAYVHLGRKPIPKGHVVSSLCGNSACCNPAHLMAVVKGDIARMNAADGKTQHWGNKNPLRKYKGLLAGQRNGQCKVSDERVLWVLSMRGKMTRPAIAKEIGVSTTIVDRIFAGKRTVTPRPPHTGESARYSGHGHRGHRTQAHGRQAGIGDGQAAAHQDPDRGHGSPDGTGFVFCGDDRP